VRLLRVAVGVVCMNMFCSEWSEIEGKLGTPLQMAGGCMDRYVPHPPLSEIDG
jgi:hypothetical protein